MKLSQKVEMILDIFVKCKSDLQLYENRLKDCENRQKDILHELEGVDDYPKNPPKYKKRAALSTQLQKTLIDRRIAKDNIQLYQPLVEFIESEVGTKAINVLKAKLGDIRKIEKNMDIRRYYRRVPDKQNKEKD